MKNGRETKGRRILLYVFGIFLLLLTGFFIALHILIPQKFKQQFSQLPRGFQIQYTGVHTNLFASAISLDNVDLMIIPDSSRKENLHHIHFSKLQFGNINFLKLATSKNFSANSIRLDSATFYLDSFLLANSDSIKMPVVELPFKKLSVESVNIPAAKFYLHGRQENKLIATGDLAFQGVRNENRKNIKWENISCKLNDIRLNIAEEELLCQELFFDSRKQELRIDSARVFSGHKLLASLDIFKASKFDLQEILDSNWTAGEIYANHLTLANPNLLKRVKWILAELPHNLKVSHFKAENVAFENMQNNQSRGRIEVSDLQVKNDSTISPENFKYSDVECEFSNVIIPFQTSTASAAYFYLDSKKQSLKIEKLRIENDNSSSVIDKIQLDHFDVRNLQNRKLIAGELNVHGIKTTGAPENLFQFANDVSFLVKINQVKASDINVAYRKRANSLSCLANVEFEGLLIENLNKDFTPDKMQFENMHCDMSGIQASVPGEMHNIQIEKLSMDSREELIEIYSLKTIPQFGKYEYGRRRSVQGNWVKASVPRIKIIEADIRSLIQKKLVAGKMIVAGSDVYVFRDRRLPRKLSNQKLPMEFMKSLPIDIRINSVTIEPSRVVYEEYPNDWIHTGVLRLEKMQMTLTPLINHPGATDPEFIDMKATGSVMGSGTASAHFKMPLKNNRVYYVNGSFENLSLPTLNSTAENLGDFSIRSGLLNFLNFEFTMTAERSSGKIVGEYHNLVVDKIKIDNHDSTRKEKAGFSSFMLHHVIIPKNKDKSMPEGKRTGKMDYPRDPTRFVTYYFIKSLLDGVRASFTFGFVLPK